ncbi:MAG: hypothetical protein Q9222_002403 [Ikaeria aurantiellina]
MPSDDSLAVDRPKEEELFTEVRKMLSPKQHEQVPASTEKHSADGEVETEIEEQVTAIWDLIICIKDTPDYGDESIKETLRNGIRLEWMCFLHTRGKRLTRSEDDQEAEVVDSLYNGSQDNGQLRDNVYNGPAANGYSFPKVPEQLAREYIGRNGLKIRGHYMETRGLP